MITAQHVVNLVLEEAAKLGRADETMVLVTDKVEATLRWAGNSMTTNGVSVSRSITVISIVRKGASAFIGTVVSAEVDPRVIPGSGGGLARCGRVRAGGRRCRAAARRYRGAR